jgi:hypothetical protein
MNNIHVYAICYNEEYMLPFFLQHYFFNIQVKEITIYDNYSTDRTPAIISDFRARFPGKALNVIPYDSGGEIRDDMYIQIKNTCWKDSNCEWVIVCDMDEFIHFRNPVEDTLEALTARGIDIVRCKGYEMVADAPPQFAGYFSPDGMTTQVKEGAARDVHNKCLLFKSNIAAINYGFGGHSIDTRGVLYQDQHDILMLHYKFLGLQYLIDIYAARAKRLSGFNKQHGFGFHYNYTEKQITQEYQDFHSKKHLIL